MKLSAVFVLLAVRFAAPARIFGFFPIPSISHQLVFRGVMTALARRGHQVTIATPDPTGLKLANYTEIDLGFVYKPFRESFNPNERTFPEKIMWSAYEILLDLVDLELSDPEVRRVLREGEFDLVMVEFILLPAVTAFSHHFRVPFIGVASLDIFAPTHELIGNPFNPAYYPEMMLPYTDKKDFFARFRSTISYLFWTLSYKYRWLPKHDALAKKHFGEDTPYIGDIEKNVSAVLVYSDFRISYPFPMVPSYIQIGGGQPIHLRDLKPLPKDLQNFLDGAKEGVIYFSLGSNAKSEAMPERKRKVFIEAFSKIKQKVLWKWETDVLPGKPDNVKIGKWLPQPDVLAHPNVKAFVTQAGLQSVSEAVHYEVPMVVIPLFADQELNAKKLVSVGAAVHINYEDLEVDTFLSALKAVINDPGYKERIIKYSQLTKDQPQSPLDRAIWWTEYVIRHKGAKHLRSAAVDLPWYQYFLLDVYAFIILVLSAVFYILYIIARSIKRAFTREGKLKKQ